MSLAGAATERLETVPLSAAIVEIYERIVPIAARQVACLREGDLDGFEALLGEKELLIETARSKVREANDAAYESRVRTGGEPSAAGARLVARAEEAIRSVLANEEQALAILLGARDRVSGELSGLARGEAGIKSYGGAGAATGILDREG